MPIANEKPHRTWAQTAAPFMFAVGLVHLMLIAGLIHRAQDPNLSNVEAWVMGALGLALWPIVLVDAVVSYFKRSPAVSRSKALSRVFLVVLMPSMRLGWIHPATNQIWLPGLGWQSPGKQLLRRLERIFGAPMLLIAFLILPVLAVEYMNVERIRTEPLFALALQVAVALIWLAFALELIIKVGAAPSSLVYLKERWLDVAIVGLPLLEFVLTYWVHWAPLARLLRLSRAISPQQLGAMGKAYRLRGLLLKGWHAFMLLEGITRLTGNSPVKRLRKVERRIALLQEEIDELRHDAEKLKAMIPKSEDADTEMILTDPDGEAARPK
jgi:hypothetical protein